MTEFVEPIRTALLERPFAFLSPFDGDEFAALLLVAGSDITSREQHELAQALVAQSCRYAVCAGESPSSWDDAIDEAAAGGELQGAPTYGFELTTWREGEPLEEVVAFFLGPALADDAEPLHRIALLVGGTAAQLASLEEALRRAGSRPVLRIGGSSCGTA